MNKKVEELVERVRLTSEEKNKAVHERCEEMGKKWHEILETGDEEIIMECEDALLQAQLNKFLNDPDLAWIDREIVLHRFTSLLLSDDYIAGTRRIQEAIIPLAELKEATDDPAD